MNSNRTISLNLELELKSGHTREEFYYFLAHTLAYFVKPGDVEQFKQQYLPVYLQGKGQHRRSD